MDPEHKQIVRNSDVAFNESVMHKIVERLLGNRSLRMEVRENRMTEDPVPVSVRPIAKDRYVNNPKVIYV